MVVHRATLAKKSVKGDKMENQRKNEETMRNPENEQNAKGGMSASGQGRNENVIGENPEGEPQAKAASVSQGQLGSRVSEQNSPERMQDESDSGNRVRAEGKHEEGSLNARGRSDESRVGEPQK